jgi:hypothetical protein
MKDRYPQDSELIPQHTELNKLMYTMYEVPSGTHCLDILERIHFYKENFDRYMTSSYQNTTSTKL